MKDRCVLKEKYANLVKTIGRSKGNLKKCLPNKIATFFQKKLIKFL